MGLESSFSARRATQGCPLAMVGYGVGVLPVIRQLKTKFPYGLQPWYADDATDAAKFETIRKHFERLCEIGPNHGYYPEPSKSILIVAEHNLERAKAAFADMCFTVVTGY